MAAVLIEMPVADVLTLFLSLLQVSPCWRWAMVLNSPEHPRDVGHWAVGPPSTSERRGSSLNIRETWAVGPSASASRVKPPGFFWCCWLEKTKRCVLSGMMTSLPRSGPVNNRGFQTGSGPVNSRGFQTASGPVNSGGFQTASDPSMSASQRTCRVCIVFSHFLNSAFQKGIPF